SRWIGFLPRRFRANTARQKAAVNASDPCAQTLPILTGRLVPIILIYKKPRLLTQTGVFYALFHVKQPVARADQKSRLATFRALASIKARRGSTSSPIRVVNILSAPMASSMVTRNIRRDAGSMVVSHNC